MIKNMIKQKYCYSPNYPLEGRQRHIEIRYTRNGFAFVLGMVDQYVYYFAKVHSENAEEYHEAFQQILSCSVENITSEYIILKDIGIKWEDWTNLYGFSAIIEDGQNFITDKRFEHINKPPYRAWQDKYNVQEFAEYSADVLQSLRELCRIRECVKNKYTKFLQEWLVYINAKKITYCRLIDDDAYLLVSEDEKLRQAYINCRKAVDKYYNEYMTKCR